MLEGPDLSRMDSHATASPSNAYMHGENVNIRAIETERQDLQKEVTLGLECAHAPIATERLRQAIATAGRPLEGLADGQALLWHFKNRVAALQCERRLLQRHLLRLRRSHLQHVAARSLPPHLAGHEQPRSQLSHVGPLVNGGCTCEPEIDAAMLCMQVRAGESPRPWRSRL